MKKELRKNPKDDFKKDFCKLANNSVFGKTNVRKHRHIKLATTEAARNYLVSEPNYHTTVSRNRNEQNLDTHE